MFSDPALVREVDQFIAQHPCACAVETGTHLGVGTIALAQRFPIVATLEANLDYYLKAVKAVQDTGFEEATPFRNCRVFFLPPSAHVVYMWYGASEDCLLEAIIHMPQPALFYLDAHWNAHCPILDELQTIADAGHGDARIIIHDFVVPEVSDFTFLADGHPLDIDYVRDALLHINPAMKWHTNTATDNNRGTLFSTA
jgi:hypothetical protein